LTFDPDHDLTKDFNEIVGGKKKRVGTDFALSSESSSKLDFGFPIKKNGVIKKGSKIALGKKSRGRPKKNRTEVNI